MANVQFETKWPPQSPHEALLSSPTGREKLRQYHDQTSPSPSPLRKSSTARIARQLDRKFAEGDDEDEETLQLQLAAIEAKLKLKKKRGKGDGVLRSNLKDRSPRDGKTAGKENYQPSSQKSESSGEAALPRIKPSKQIEIPVSPPRKPTVTEEAKSPGRILLGIDKGLKGKNISLRRPAENISKTDDPFLSNPTSDRVSISFSNSRNFSASGADQTPRPKSFSEKIAETRREDKALKERTDRVRQQRSTGFGVKQQEIDEFHSAAHVKAKSIEQRSRSEGKAGIGEFSRDEILKAANRVNGNPVHRSNTSAGIRRSRATPSTDTWTNPNAPPDAPNPPLPESNVPKKRSRTLSPDRELTNHPSQKENSTEEPASQFEPFSSLHLSKRLLPHDFLTRIFSGKHLFLLPDLLGTVTSPDYMLSDIPEPDYVVLATIASKSSPLNHKGYHKATASESTSVTEAAESEQNTNGKYMVLTLTNLKWTVDLFLFATGYTRFRKLVPGTVVALLNPDIMPPPPGKADTGRFSLKLSSSDDTVLEIGTSRDLGWCKSVRKDGKQCETWIDKRHTEFCEFHVDVVVERTRRGRMEVQGMSAPFAPGGRKGGRTGYYGDRRRREQNPTKDNNINPSTKEGVQYDRSSSSRYFIAPSCTGQTTAQLLDAEGATDRYGDREDRIRKRLAEREKENEIAKRLGQGGNGAGSEYLRLKQGLGPTVSKPENPEPVDPVDPVDAGSLGLLRNKAREVHLSPVKKRKAEVLMRAETETARRKKTRFVTDKGIKEAGRESFGGVEVVRGRGGGGEDEDDGDGLEVI